MQGLLVCFLQDYSITERTDLNGNHTGGYELFTSGSVGGHMHNLCANYIVKHYGRKAIEEALLEKQKYKSFLYSEESKDLWNCTDEMTRLLNERINEIAKRINDYKSIDSNLKGAFGSGFELL